jgi:Leucine-rich repeat (LRR) protein
VHDHPCYVPDTNVLRLTIANAGGTQLQLPPWTAFKDSLRRLNWASLQRLSLPSMNLSGPIGPLAYYLPQLTMLDLSNNQLSGVVPPDMAGAYSSLLHVNFSSNALYGGC